MTFHVTVRYGTRYQRYHTFEVAGEDVRAALSSVVDSLPDDVAETADLVEVRRAVDPDDRAFMGEG